MPEYCTCGAQLPPDAVFCHKCGKPQRDIVPVEPEPLVQQQAPVDLGIIAPQPEPIPMNFRNPIAVRIAALVAVGATALFFIPYINWLAAGYFAVFLYKRKTGARLNLGAGVKIGWMTGLLTFAILAVFFSAFVVLLNSDGMREIFQAQIRNSPDPRIQQVLSMVQSVPEVLGMLANFFIFTTCLSMAGGALGAKLLGPTNPRRGGRTA
jgi:hypothetical protein